MPYQDGDVFAGYTIQRLLGAGGMGEVYLARHPRLPRLDALKILSLGATGDENFRARFIREADLAATLWHPHIVGVHDRGEYDGRLWISMDYVEGTDARQLLMQKYPSGMPYDDVVEIVTAVAEALDFAHERRLLHRDVKPANILLTEPSGGARRRILLTDFGIGRETDDVDGLTDVDIALGTVSYAAPEQLISNDIDGRVDQYALAATAYHLLTGVPLFDHTNRVVVVGNHLKTPPPKLSARRPDLAHLDAVLAKALSKDPADRYPTCTAFAQALAGGEQAAGPPARAVPDSTPTAALDTPEPGMRTPGMRTPGIHTSAFDVAADLRRNPLDHTMRLTPMAVHGTARDVRKQSAGPGDDQEVWTFAVEQDGSTEAPGTLVPVELRGTSISGRLADGDLVEVHGLWDGATLLGESVVNRSVRTDRRRGPGPFAVSSDTSPQPPPPPRDKGRATRAVVVTMAAVVVVAVAVAAVLTHGFGLWAPASGPGPVVTPTSATVFSPGGAPDHPDEAGLAVDGNPDTAWHSDTYVDAKPFPVFKQGVGLILQLPESTGIGAVTIDVASTGTEVQLRAADSADPAGLDDTTPLTGDVALQPGQNRISVDDHTPTEDLLVWIPTLGTIDGQSRTEISEITVESAG
ncbi:serine/threonine protein kinase [Mycobacterium sp. Y57]|uniref:serine/threonine-protein kinase n=1 Tax=Mycolicibacterium xanthum TaxID=2796469 RepID=UPI001C843238|nr:serine/threonine-protein kinase [Mycolicibacterium xanthum]MBX7434460.1 serine/threonine protein kinase [Mycolicibacterium xanthum]